MAYQLTLVEICRVETGLKLVSVTGVKCDTGVKRTCLRDGAGIIRVFITLMILVCHTSYVLGFSIVSL